MREDLQKTFWILVGIFALADLVSWFSFQQLTIMPWVFGLLLLGLGVLGWRWPWVPAMASLAELTVGGQGYLWFITIGPERLSFRIALFLLVIALAVWHWWRAHSRPVIPAWRPTVIFLTWIVVMAGVGWFKGFGLREVWLDVNGFLYLAIGFAWAVLWPKKRSWKDLILTVLLAGVTYLSFKTWVMALVFSQSPETVADIYRWIRNSGVGEVTHIRESAYRIFFQSQIYGLLALLATLGAFIWGRAPRWWMWPMIASALSIYMSLSRSFWIGLGVGLVILAILSWRNVPRQHLARWLILAPLAAVIWLMANWAYQWPYVFQGAGGTSSNLVATRLSGTQSAQASNARLNQLEPLKQAIYQSPVLGHGFGKKVTYFSTDPRVKGFRTTSAFELGYLDLILKSGLLGLILLAWLTWVIVRMVWKSPNRWLWLGGLSGLYVLHLTTPYLNHPLGLGWLALTAVYTYGE